MSDAVQYRMADSLRVPAFTAYVEPDAERGARVSESDGVTEWRRGQRIVWLGKFARAGILEPSVFVRASGSSRLRLTIHPVAGGKRQEVRRESDGKSPGPISFGALPIQPGYWCFTLETVRGSPPALDALLLAGPAVEGARFNLKERRNAASVHLGYPAEKEAKIVAFYNEVTAREDPVHTYYMACGFARGYFGMQVNSPTERRIIFSVWDAGGEAVDRSKVADDDRVRLLEKGAGVFAGDFGNEGTGGHSHLVYSWKKDQTYRFCVAAKPDEAKTHTEYSGWFYFPEKRSWGLIARFRAPRDGGYLRGLYSFSENFGGDNGQLLRRAEFGNQWATFEGGARKELTAARFTCDATGRAGDRIDFAAGPSSGGRFFLQHGGFSDNGVKYGDTFVRPAAGKPPADLPG